MGIFEKTNDSSILDSLIGNSTVIDGTLASKGSICIKGKVKGKIICDGSVLVEERGMADASIIADTVIINGEMKGNIIAKAKLEITNNGKFRGDVKTGSLIITEGVLFEGKCEMITEGYEIQSSEERLEKEELHENGEFIGITNPRLDGSARGPQK